jgi:hypothetical protein
MYFYNPETGEDPIVISRIPSVLSQGEMFYSLV